MSRLLCALLLLVPGVAGAEVVERAPNSFLTRTSVTITAEPERVFQLLVGEIDQWWNKEHTYSGDSGNLWLTPNPGGCFCETLEKGGGIEHAVVSYVVPGEVLRLRGALGPLHEHAVLGTWTWNLVSSNGGTTTATVSYSVSGFFPGGLDRVADIVDTVLSEQLMRLKTHVEAAAKRPQLPIPR